MITEKQKALLIIEARKALNNPYPEDTKTVYACAVLQIREIYIQQANIFQTLIL